MYLLRLLAVLFVLLVCQATWVPKIAVFGVMPDLFVALTFAIAVSRGMTAGAWAGLLIGLLLDVEQPALLGMNAVALSASGFVVGRLSAQLEPGNPLVLGVLLFLAALTAESVRAVGLGLSGAGSPVALWFRFALPGAVYTMLLIPALSKGVAILLGRKDWVLGAA